MPRGCGVDCWLGCLVVLHVASHNSVICPEILYMGADLQKQKQKLLDFLRSRPRPSQHHFRYIPLVKGGHMVSPGSRGGEIDSSSWWEEHYAHPSQNGRNCYLLQTPS